MTSATRRDIAEHVFAKVNGSTYECLIWKDSYKVSGNDYTNLKPYIKTKHESEYRGYFSDTSEKTTLNIDKF